jgi:ferredoxin
MCEFCTQHGEGKKWYLNARNYSTDLLNELERRKFITHFYHETIEKGNRSLNLLEKILHRRLLIPRAIRERGVQQSKIHHFGQVIPLEEISKILDITTSIVRVNCGCRWAAEKKESRTCYGLSIGPPHWYELLDIDFFGSPEISQLENLTKEEALTAMADAEREGMMHSLWTVETPFIGAICNCDERYCLAMRSSLGQKMPVMFRAEYVAVVSNDSCKGCKACVEKCQFNAINYQGKKKPVTIDAAKCFGCGVCRAFCPEDAISLLERENHPVAGQFWM